MFLKEILDKKFLNNTIENYLLFILFFIIGIFIIKLTRIFILKKAKQIAEKTDTKFDDFIIYLIDKKTIPVLYFGIFYLSIHKLTLNAKFLKLLNVAGLILFATYGIILITNIINYLLETYFLKKEEDAAKLKNFKGLISVSKFILWSLTVIFLLDNFGFKISTVIAGLGIGGIAIALAAQAILGDLFSYFAILFDKPFEVGDFIVIGDFRGTVEHIGVKTTRIRSLSGEQVIFSNTDLTSSRLRNYKRMNKRRIDFKIGVVYDTPLDKIKKIPDIIKNIISKIEIAEIDRVHFVEFGDFSLNFEIVYYVLDRDYALYRDVQQKINLKLMEEFKKENIEFAFPTQTIYIEKNNKE